MELTRENKVNVNCEIINRMRDLGFIDLSGRDLADLATSEELYEITYDVEKIKEKLAEIQLDKDRERRRKLLTLAK